MRPYKPATQTAWQQINWCSKCRSENIWCHFWPCDKQFLLTRVKSLICRSRTLNYNKTDRVFQTKTHIDSLVSSLLIFTCTTAKSNFYVFHSFSSRLIQSWWIWAPLSQIQAYYLILERLPRCKWLDLVHGKISSLPHNGGDWKGRTWWCNCLLGGKNISNREPSIARLYEHLFIVYSGYTHWQWRNSRGVDKAAEVYPKITRF